MDGSNIVLQISGIPRWRILRLEILNLFDIHLPSGMICDNFGDRASWIFVLGATIRPKCSFLTHCVCLKNTWKTNDIAIGISCAYKKWHDERWCGVKQYDTIRNNTIQDDKIQYKTKWYNTIWYQMRRGKIIQNYMRQLYCYLLDLPFYPVPCFDFAFLLLASRGQLHWFQKSDRT